MRTIGLGLAAATLVLAIAAPAAQADEKTVVVQAGPNKQVWVQHRAKHWETEHRTWVQRGGYVGYRVPEASFSVAFGPEHTFRIGTVPVRVEGAEPRFQVNGYWMAVMDPWPESWPEGWYDSDDLFVRYENGGYYLYNTKYPGIGLALQFYQ
jgi:hypothetical protein